MKIEILKIYNGYLIKYWFNSYLEGGVENSWYAKTIKEAKQYIQDKLDYFLKEDKDEK